MNVISSRYHRAQNDQGIGTGFIFVPITHYFYFPAQFVGGFTLSSTLGYRMFSSSARSSKS